mmetsp:Transcript_12889/g.51460  ORF Transcript_12889/g.51460 Transcript_12889/m.51460 type:complete len:232 (-) Transcript_12889:274-969(-)
MSFVGGGVSSQLSVTDSYLEATAKREGEPIGVLVLYDGSIPQMKSMADAAKRGVESVTGITVEMYRLPPDPASDKTVISSVFDDQTFQKSLYHKLESADGVLFGIPGQYGLPPAAVKKFFDSLGDRKAIGSLNGKLAGVFTSSPMQGAGQETTIFTTITQLAALGMIFVPTGYGFGPAMFDLSELHGGSPFGAGVITGPDNKREPSPQELEYAQYQGCYFGLMAKRVETKR